MYSCNKVEGKRERKRVGGGQEREKQSKESRSKQKRRNQKKEKKGKMTKTLTLNYFVMFIRYYKQYNSTEILSQKKKSLRFFLDELPTHDKFCQEDG